MDCKVFCQTEVIQEIEGVPDEGYAPYFFGVEGSTLPFRFTDASFTRVLSALANGAYLTYGNEGRQVVWDFLVNVEFPLPFCAQIIECIEGDPDVQAALADFLANNPLAQKAIQGLIDNGTVVPNPTGVIVTSDDLDALFGSITFLVDTMNGLNEDLYQAIEASSNAREQGALVFRAIPVLNELPFDEVSEYIDNLIADVAENYDAEYTTTPISGMRDKIRCALFCVARDNDKSLTWQMIADYFWGKVGYSSDPIRAFRDFVTFFKNGTWPGEQIVYISFANIASVLTSASKFSEMTLPSLSSLMKLGLNDPDPDWTTLCDDCPETYTHTWDFTVEDGGFETLFDLGHWVSGSGWQDGLDITGAGQGYRGLALTKDGFASTTIHTVRYEYGYLPGILDATGDKTSFFSFESYVLIDVSSPTVPTSPQTWSGDATGDNLYLQLFCGVRLANSDPGGSCVLRKLIISGDGMDPF